MTPFFERDGWRNCQHQRRTVYLRHNAGKNELFLKFWVKPGNYRSSAPRVLCCGLSCTDKFKHFEQRNSLEQKVKKAEMDRSEADSIMKQMLAKEAQQREQLEHKMEAQAKEYR